MSNEQAQQQAAGKPSKEAAPAGKAKFKANSQKALAFALMLTVPVALSGCNTTNTNDCVEYDSNDYCDDDDGRGGTYILNGKTYKKSSSYKSGSSSSKGFGSSGISSGSSGG